MQEEMLEKINESLKNVAQSRKLLKDINLYVSGTITCSDGLSFINNWDKVNFLLEKAEEILTKLS
jgi:hypothetical protein